jgi:NADH-quinone oxidoreductase subunit E
MVVKDISVIRGKAFSISWKTRVERILDRYGRDIKALLPCLETIQETSGYITPESVTYLRDVLNIPAANIYSVATFYGLLTTRQQGKYVVRLCNSLSCKLNSANSILQVVEDELNIKHGETTEDNRITLEVVACLGLCDKAPAMMINDKIYGPLTKNAVMRIIADLKENG